MKNNNKIIKEQTFEIRITDEIDSRIYEKKNELLHNVGIITKHKFDMVEKEISNIFSEKSKTFSLEHESEMFKLQNDIESVKHLIHIADNELKTLFFIKNSFGQKQSKELRRIDKSVI